MATTKIIALNPEQLIIESYTRELRTVLTDLHDEPLDEGLARSAVQLLVHRAPAAREALRKLESQRR